MGLSERRRIKLLVDERVPAFARKFHEESGLGLPVAVDIESLSAISDMAVLNSVLDWVSGDSNYGEFWNEAIAAWKAAAADDLGKQVIGELVPKGWTVRYVPGASKGLELKDGLLIQRLGDGSSEYPRMFIADFARELDALLVTKGLPLGELRRVDYIKTSVVPKYQAEIKEATGHDIELVLVDNFAKMPAGDPRGGTLDWVSGYTNSGEFWTELVTALRAICSDDMGREAVAASIRRIEVVWESQVGADLSCKNGTLTYHYNFADCPSDGSYRLFAGDIQRRLEAML